MKNTANTRRVVTFLDREELEFLDKLEKDIMFSSGMHISRSKIIEDMVGLFAKTQMNASGIKSDEDFQQRLLLEIQRLCRAEAGKGEIK